MNIIEQIEKLKEASKIEDTELGEAWELLTSIRDYSYIFSDEFNKAIAKEIDAQYEDLKLNYDIVEERLLTRLTKPYKRLKHKDES